MATRIKNEARVYVRRSTGKQESGVHTQLEWAIGQARSFGVTLKAEPADLEHMLAAGLTQYKDIFLDDGVTGANLARPGFSAFRREAIENPSISHLFIHMADRFARPDRASEALTLEHELSYAGLTVVFSNRVCHPRQRGGNYVLDDLQSVLAYSESGEFLNKLAVRVIEAKTRLARQGHWAGGRPPYGFVRVRVDADGTETEMSDKTSIRRPGSHTAIRPKDLDKIRIWILMIDWYTTHGWGAKRIAGELNRLGIPSPDAGRTRTDSSVKHRVSGRWSPNAVAALLRNSAIVGVQRYGVQSEGHHRRLGEDGQPRHLDDADQIDGKPKVVQNADELIIVSEMKGFKPPIERESFERVREAMDLRGRNQRGIPRSRDLGRYPLSTRVFDATCGHPMYGRTCSGRALYTCGRYINTAGAECDHNQVDAEAALSHVLGVLRQRVIMLGGREHLEARLREMAAAEQRECRGNPAATDAVRPLQSKLASMREDLSVITKNLSRARDDDEYAALSVVFREKSDEVKAAERALERALAMRSAASDDADVDTEVRAGMALFDHVERVTADPDARQNIRAMFNQVNLKLWLNFSEGRKGKRTVRVLTGGVVTTGDAPGPIRPYGADAICDGEPERDVHGRGGSGVCLKPLDVSVNETPSPEPVDSREGVSLRKVHRGDKI